MTLVRVQDGMSYYGNTPLETGFMTFVLDENTHGMEECARLDPNVLLMTGRGVTTYITEEREEVPVTPLQLAIFQNSAKTVNTILDLAKEHLTRPQYTQMLSLRVNEQTPLEISEFYTNSLRGVNESLFHTSTVIYDAIKQATLNNSN